MRRVIERSPPRPEESGRVGSANLDYLVHAQTCVSTARSRGPPPCFARLRLGILPDVTSAIIAIMLDVMHDIDIDAPSEVSAAKLVDLPSAISLSIKAEKSPLPSVVALSYALVSRADATHTDLFSPILAWKKVQVSSCVSAWERLEEADCDCPMRKASNSGAHGRGTGETPS